MSSAALIQNPPDFQFLVCLKQSSTGGISTFADGIHVASILRQSRPDLYQALVERRVIYKDDEKDWQVSARYKMNISNDFLISLTPLPISTERPITLSSAQTQEKYCSILTKACAILSGSTI